MLPVQNIVYVVQIFILRWKKGLFPMEMLATFKTLYFLHFHLFSTSFHFSFLTKELFTGNIIVVGNV